MPNPEYYYNVKVVQNKGGKTDQDGRVFTLESLDNPHYGKMITQSPGEFNGPKNEDGKSINWTPEDLFVASLAVCLEASFITVATNSKLNFSGVEVTAKGILEEDPKLGKYFPKVIQKMIITVPDDKFAHKAERVGRLAEKNCLVGKSIKSEKELQIEVKIES